MEVTRWFGVVGVASLAIAPVAFAAEVAAQREGAPGRPERPPISLGLMADAGIPDGANAALAVRPASWLRIHAGGGHNTVSAGLRGGVTWLPLGAGPSLSVELGHYADGDASGFVRGLVGARDSLAPLFERVGYTYVNGQLGLELGRGPAQFFVHAGFSYLWAVIHNADDALAAQNKAVPSGGSITTVRITEEPRLRVWAPSVKLGLVIYFWGGT